MAEWQSGHAADCKSVNAGSIPTSASKIQLEMDKKNVSKALIPVAGLGTRMLPATKAIPKELLPIYDKPLIQHVVEEAISGGIKEIILITRSGKEAIENHFDNNYELEHRLEVSGKRKILKSVKNLIPKNIKISSIRQENALGLGHAILCAEHLLKNEPFAVLLPDEFLVQKELSNDFAIMMKNFTTSGSGQLLVEKVLKRDVPNYGVVDLKKKILKLKSQKKVFGLIEKPKPKNSPSNLRIVGRYILPFSTMNAIKKLKPGRDGEIQLTDAINYLVKKDLEEINANLSTSEIYDCGSKTGFLGANISLASKNKKIKRYIKEIIK